MNISKEIKEIRIFSEEDKEYLKSPFEVILANNEIQKITQPFFCNFDQVIPTVF